MGSADEATEGGYTLAPHGRYQHKRSYLEGLLTNTGFTNLQLDEVHLRNEGGEPVQGWLVSASRPE